MAHIIIPLYQSKVATTLHITTAYLADNDNCTVHNFIYIGRLSYNMTYTFETTKVGGSVEPPVYGPELF